jgi:glycosyltransferase involved in cell wall biosynthesis
MLVLHRSSFDPGVTVFRPSRNPVFRLRRWAVRTVEGMTHRLWRRGVPDSWELFSPAIAPFGREPLGQMPPADVVHLHWTQGFLEPAVVFSALLDRQPIIWSLHDANAFTGGCHYPGGCGRFLNGCGSCPQLGRPGPNDWSRRIWRRKAGGYGAGLRHPLLVVANSRWLHAMASQSPLLEGFDLRVVYPGVDTTIFAPFDQRLAREALGWPREGLHVAFVADILTNNRKGLNTLLAALMSLPPGERPRLVVMGRGQPRVDAGLEVTRIPSVDHERFLALVYNAADIVAVPSREEAFGFTAVEAMACGRAVVVAATGGLSETVVDGETGITVEPGDAGALANALRVALADTEARRRLGAAARSRVLGRFDLEAMCRGYSELYRELLASAGARAGS